MKSRWRIWKGREVLHLDYAGFKGDIDALRREVEAADRIISSQRPGSLLVFIDLRDTVGSTAAVQLFKESASMTTPYIHRHALIGVTGIKKFLADKVARLVGKPMRLFDDERDALDWLVADAGEAGLSHVGEEVGGRLSA
jgi:hypothetical protein